MNLNFEKQKIEERHTLDSCSFRTFSDLFEILPILSCDCMEMMFSFIRSMYSLHPDDVGKVAIAEGGREDYRRIIFYGNQRKPMMI